MVVLYHGYVGRTAETLLADMERKHPELKRNKDDAA